jgi:hypothetical protein
VPTAQMLLVQEAVTPNSAALSPRLGLATSRQRWPFQNAVSVLAVVAFAVGAVGARFTPCRQARRTRSELRK